MVCVFGWCASYIRPHLQYSEVVDLHFASFVRSPHCLEKAVGILRRIKQVGRRIVLLDLSVSEHENTVVVNNGIKPVRDGENGAVAKLLFDGFLYQSVGVMVHRARRLVEEEDARRPQKRSCEAKLLPLTHRKIAPSFFNLREGMCAGGGGLK